MVVVMTKDASEADIDLVCEKVRAAGGEAFVSHGTVHTVIGLVGDTERFQAIAWTQLHGVDHVIKIGKAYKMVARDLHPEASVVKVGPTPVGRDTFTLIAGPCADESGEGRRRDDPPWRRLQAANVAVLVPGPGRTGPRDPAGVQARDRPSHGR
jgi:3-deoxy-7-phosphoheptulonate synthase